MNGSRANFPAANADTEMPRLRLSACFRRFVIATVIALAAVLPRCAALGQDVSTQFPEPAQVTADYPDDVQRWGALNVLYMALNNAAPKPMSRAAYAKFSAYEASYNALVTAKMADRQAYKDFNARCDQLFSNPTFAHSVLEKYRLTAYAKRQAPAAPLAAQPPPAQNPPQRPWSPLPVRRPLSANDEWIYPRAFPLLLLFLLPVAFCTWAALQVTGSGHQVLPTRPPIPGGLPALPEALRVVSVPGARYAVYVLSGIVLEKEELEHRYSFSTTTPGQTLHMGGGQYQYTPAQTSTYSESVREQIIWVRSPEGREQSWTLYNSDLRLRPGQIVSALVRPLPKDTGDILMIYNHTAGTVDKCPAMAKAHGNQGFIRREIVQWTANLACGLAAAIVTFVYLPLFGGGGIYPPFVIWWLFGSLVLVTLSFLIVTPWMTRRTLKRRDAAFDRKYLPGLRQFFEQGTPILQRAFARA